VPDDEFLAAFEAAAIPRPEWTHAAHVRMAWLDLTRLPPGEALERVRGGIRRLNAANAARRVPRDGHGRVRAGDRRPRRGG
jgi:hypothetical protein